MVENFIKIFEGYNWARGTFTKDKSKLPGKAEGKSTVYREEVTKPIWENHLNGIGPSLGIMPVNENSEAQWGCIDVDDFNLDYEGILQNIRKIEKQYGFVCFGTVCNINEEKWVTLRCWYVCVTNL